MRPRRGSGFLVGRQQELTQLWDALDQAAAGVGGLVLVAGEPGIGKTSLVGELAVEARAEDVRVLWGRCPEGGGSPPYWPWIQVLGERGRSPPDPYDDLVDLLTSAEGQAGPGIDAHDGRHRLRLFDRVVSSLRMLAAEQPVLVILEDVHAADPSSLLLLSHVAADLPALRVLAVATLRDPPGLPADAPAELGRRARWLALDGLDEADIGALVEALADAPVPPAVRQAIHRATGGNPYFADSVARLLAGSGPITDPGAITIPGELRAAIRERLAVLSDETIRILSVGAVMGEHVPLAPLGLVTHRPQDALVERLSEAAAAGLVVGTATGGYRFRHGLVRETLYDDLAARQRQSLHLRVGEVLAGLSAGDPAACPPAVLAHHLLEALPEGDRDTAVRRAREAAEAASAVHAYEEAARLYERALVLISPDDARGRLAWLLPLGQAQWRAGQVSSARQTFVQAAAIARDIGDPEQLALAALGAGGGRVEQGVVDHDLIALLEEALEGLDDGPLRARVLGRLAVALYFTPQHERREELTAAAVRLAEGEPALVAASLAARHFAIWSPDTLDERLRIAAEIVALGRRTGDRELVLEGRTWMIIDLLEAGNVAAADAEIDTFAASVAEVGLPLYEWYAALFEATRTAWRGPLEDAEAAAGRALGIGRRAGVASAEQFYGVHLYVLRRDQGRLAELEQPVRALIDAYPDYEVWTCALARLLVDTGRQAEARRLVDPLAVDGFTALPRDVNWLVSLALLAEVVDVLGSAERAEQLHDLLAPFADRLVVVASAAACLGPVSYHLGALCASMGRDDAAAEHFTHALAMADAASAPTWADRIRRRAGVLLHATIR